MKTFKQCLNLVTSSPPNSISSNEDMSSSVLAMVSSNQLEVQSLSHLYLIIGTLKTALWDHCKQDPEEVATTLKNTIISHNSSYADKLEEILTPLKESSNINQTLIQKKNVAGLNQSKIDSPIAIASSKDLHPSNKEELLGDDDSNVEKEDSHKNFEIFISNVGKSLNDSFEDTKETLRVNKNRQREIIAMLNNQKSIIDNLSQQISILDEFLMAEQNVNLADEVLEEKIEHKINLESELNNAKKSYR
jgi:hypothetical protein